MREGEILNGRVEHVHVGWCTHALSVIAIVCECLLH